MQRTGPGKRIELSPRDIETFKLLRRYRYLRSTYIYAFVGGASETRFKERLIARHEGVKSVINLRGQNPKKKWWQREKAVCEELGIAHYEARLDSKKIATREMLLDLLSAFDCAPKPFLVKCQGGADRTSFAAALYALHCGHQLSVAQLHFNPLLHRPEKKQEWLKEFTIYAKDSKHEKSLSQWIEADYEPEKFIEWMESRGMFGAHDGIFDSASFFAA